MVDPEEKKPKTDLISIFLAAEEGRKKREDGGKWEDALRCIVCRIEFKSV